MRDSIKTNRFKNETTDAKTEEFELDEKQKNATIFFTASNPQTKPNETIFPTVMKAR